MPEVPDGDEIIFFLRLCAFALLSTGLQTLYHRVTKTCHNIHRQYQHRRHFQLTQSLSRLQTHPEVCRRRDDQPRIDLRVLHIPGSKNDVADTLSCSQFSKARSLVPRLVIIPFEPPHNVLGH